MNSSLTCTVVIVTYNSAATIGPCLASVLATTSSADSIVIIDNNSRDNTVEIVRVLAAASPTHQLKLIANTRNMGFSIATNQGIAASQSHFVVLLNPDTVVAPFWLQLLAAHFNESSIGAVGPVSNFACGRQSIACHWRGQLPESMGFEDAAAQLYGVNCGITEETPLLIGYCLMIRRDIVVRLGGLDERLFLGNDDLEISWRLRLHGYRLCIATDVFVYHEGQHSFRTEPETFTGKLVQESSDALYSILEESYGTGRVPPPECLWGIEWFKPTNAAYSKSVDFSQVIHLPMSRSPIAIPFAPLVSIIILTYNQREYTKECLEAIARNTTENHEIILVDNASSDGTPEWLEELATRNTNYRLILNKENRGFAAGCNQGLAVAQGDYIVLLNNDVVVTAEWLTGLFECYYLEPDTGIVGPVTNNASGIQGLGMASYQSHVELEAFAGELRKNRRYSRVLSRRLVGFCMLLSRRLYQEIGGLDEQFGTGNFEDDDFCLRASIAGYQNVVAGDVYVHHHGSVSFKGAGIDYNHSITNNGRIFHEKWSCPVESPQLAKMIAACRVRDDSEFLLLHERFDEAEIILAKARYDFPHDTHVISLYGYVLLALHRSQEALQFVQGSSVLQTVVEALLELEQGNLSCAETLIVSGAASGNRHGLLYQLRGLLAIAKGEYEYAAHLTITGICLFPLLLIKPDIVEWLLCHGYAGQLVKEVGKNRQLYPNSRLLARMQVLCYEELGRDAELLSAAEQAVRDFPLDAHILQAGIGARRRQGLWRTIGESGQSVSLCMIVKNEEKHLARCLASCRPLVSEMIVVDTGSTDHTASIAELFGAKVLNHTWQDDFSEARNISLATATSEWILVMDADEVLSTQDYYAFNQMLKDHIGKNSAFTLETRNYTNNSSLENWRSNDNLYTEQAGTGWTPSSKLRLWRNIASVRFINPVHELVEGSAQQSGLAFYTCVIPVHHYGGLDNVSFVAKEELYYKLGLKKLAQSGWQDVRALYELAVQAGGMARYAEAEALYRKTLEFEPNNFLAWFNLGYVLLREGKFAEAKQASTLALELDNTLFEAEINKAICDVCVGNSCKAIAALEDVLHRHPDSVAAQVVQALAFLQDGQQARCVSHLTILHSANIQLDDFITDFIKVLFKAGNALFVQQILEIVIPRGFCAGEKLKQLLAGVT